MKANKSVRGHNYDLANIFTNVIITIYIYVQTITLQWYIYVHTIYIHILVYKYVYVDYYICTNIIIYIEYIQNKYV